MVKQCQYCKHGKTSKEKQYHYVRCLRFPVEVRKGLEDYCGEFEEKSS
jgi:hypothetical protein